MTAKPPSDETDLPQLWWFRLCNWLLKRLLWIWSAIILGIGINISSSWLITTSKTFTFVGTPLGWLLDHLQVAIPVGGSLLVLTAITGIVTVIHRRPAPQYSSSTLEQRNRKRFLVKLQSRYDDILKQSLQEATQITLGFRSSPDVVINTMRLRFHQTAQSEQEFPAGMSILQVYEQVGGELLILGEPGAGKTLQMLNLARGLRDRAMRDEHNPLPVIVNLSTWANARRPLQEWLIEEIATSYNVPRRAITKWIESDQLLPLLDGLDEVPLPTRVACIEAINVFHQEHFVSIVVCSRSGEYFEQQNRLVLQGAVVIQPLNEVQVDTYFKEAGSPLASVRAVLRKSAELRELVKTPLMLHILMLAYQGVSVRSLPKKGSIEEQQRQVLDQYVQRMLNQQASGVPSAVQQTKRRLTWLAQQMQHHNQTIFYLEQLQSDWLPSSQLQGIYGMFAVRFPGILIGILVSMLVNGLLFYAGDTMTTLQDVFFSGLVGGLLVGSSTQLVSNVLKRTWKPRLSWAWKSKWRSLLFIGLSFSLFFGITSGLSFGILWYENLRNGVIAGISTGLMSIILGLLIEADKVPGLAVMPNTKTSHLQTQWFTIIKHICFGASAGLLIGICVGLSEGLGGGSRFGGGFGISFGIEVGLSEGLHFGIISLLLSLLLFRKKEVIELTEVIVWSVKRFGKSLTKKHHLINTLYTILLVGLLTWLSGGLGLGLYSGLERGSNLSLPNELGFGLREELNAGISAGLSVGLAYWILLGLWNGITHEVLSNQLRVAPNQGIRNSGRNSLLVGLTAGGLCGFIGFLSNMLFIILDSKQNILGFSPWLGIALSEGIIIGIAGGFLAGLLIGGGLAWYRHYVLHYLLWRADIIPWNYIQFLDEAARHILLFKEGGGYRFTHRLLQDYFADLNTEITPLSMIAQTLKS